MVPLDSKTLKRQLRSSDPSERIAASQSIIKHHRNIAFKAFVQLLQSKKSYVRDNAALGLRKLKDDRAIPFLLSAIHKPENKHFNGTLVYALEVLDCKNIFLTLIDLALHGDYEVQCHALNILREQGFTVTKEEIEKAERAIEEFSSNPTCEDAELLLSELSRYVRKIEK